MKKTRMLFLGLMVILVLTMTSCSKDEIAPAIRLSQRTVNVYAGAELPDFAQYAVAIDEKEGDLTRKIQIDSQAVDVNTPGKYEVVYTVRDRAGNTAKGTITVNVLYNARWQPAMKDGIPAMTFTREEFQTLWNTQDESGDILLDDGRLYLESDITRMFGIGSITFEEFNDGTLYRMWILWGDKPEYNLNDYPNVLPIWLKEKAGETVDGETYAVVAASGELSRALEILFPNEYAYEIIEAMATAYKDRQYNIPMNSIDTYSEDVNEYFEFNGYRINVFAISNAVIFEISAAENENDISLSANSMTRPEEIQQDLDTTLAALEDLYESEGVQTTGEGEYWCMGKDDTCQNKTYSANDLYCSSCDPDGDNREG